MVNSKGTRRRNLLNKILPYRLMGSSPALNERQLAILALLAAGRTNAEIAGELHLSPNTVKWYLQQIYQALGARNRVEALEAARTGGLLGEVFTANGADPELPPATTPFFGRETELAALSELLRRPDLRLITLCGLGGAGKTRLALEAGRRVVGDFPEGVRFVPLEAARSRDEAWDLTRRRLQIPLNGATANRRLIANALLNRRLLLIVDNVEHLGGLPADLAWLLTRTRHLKLLVTSRARLNLQAEQFFPINGVGHQGGAGSPAFKLFLHTARRQNPGYRPSPRDEADIVSLCELVEGMPLALELAAAWSDVLPPGRILADIQTDLSRLAQPAADRPARHHSLWAVFNYSWGLLGENERRAALALCPLHAPFSREAALAISGASPAALQQLLRTSLVQPAADGRLVIHELVRLFLEEKARRAGFDLDTVHERAMTFYLACLAEESTRLRQTLSATALSQIAANLNPILAAWQRAVDRSRWELLEACIDLAMYYEARGLWADGAALYARTRQAVPASQPRLRARLDEALALFAFRTFDMKQGKKLADRALAVLEEQAIGPDGAGVYAHLARSVYAYAARGYGAYAQLVEEIQPLTQAHFGEFSGIMPHIFAGMHHCAQGRYARSAAIFEALVYRSNPDIYSLPNLRCMLALAYLGLEEADLAREQFQAALARGRKIAIYPALVTATYELARLENPQSTTADLQQQLLALAGEVGGRPQLGRLVIHTGGAYISFGYFREARQLFRSGLKILQGEVGRAEMAATMLLVAKFMLYRLAIAGRK